MTSKYRFTRCIKCMTLLGRSVVKGLILNEEDIKIVSLLLTVFFSECRTVLKY